MSVIHCKNIIKHAFDYQQAKIITSRDIDFLQAEYKQVSYLIKMHALVKDNCCGKKSIFPEASSGLFVKNLFGEVIGLSNHPTGTEDHANFPRLVENLSKNFGFLFSDYSHSMDHEILRYLEEYQTKIKDILVEKYRLSIDDELKKNILCQATSKEFQKYQIDLKSNYIVSLEEILNKSSTSRKIFYDNIQYTPSIVQMTNIRKIARNIAIVSLCLSFLIIPIIIFVVGLFFYIKNSQSLRNTLHQIEVDILPQVI